MRPDEIDRAAIQQRAERCLELMDDNERAAVSLGLLPHWTALEDLGGKDTAGVFHALQGDEFRQHSVALMGLVKMRA